MKRKNSQRVKMAKDSATNHSLFQLQQDLLLQRTYLEKLNKLRNLKEQNTTTQRWYVPPKIDAQKHGLHHPPPANISPPQVRAQ